jgi:hypothetical protein
MTFKAYRSGQFEHAHENIAFNHLHDLLERQWRDQDEPLYLFGNFFAGGTEFDALILKRNAVIVIDLKDYGGNLVFSENGRWKIDGTVVRGGTQTNPYQQIRTNKFRLLDYFKEYLDFQSAPNLGHIAGLCLFHQAIDFDASSLPQNISRWFHITDMRSVIRSTDAIVSSGISFSNRDLEAIISKLDVPVFHPDGRPVETLQPIYDDEESAMPSMLNGEQTRSYVAIHDWLADTNKKVFSLAGAFYTGKTKILKAVVDEIVSSGKTPLFLAPNSRIANRYKSSGFSDVSSIYSWLYAGSPNEIRNDKAIYPIAREPIDADREVVVILDAHLLGNDLFETETSVYGSGHILSDFVGSLKGVDLSSESKSANALPKILLIGDPYQLTRGSRDKSLLGCQIFEQEGIECARAEVNSQDRDDQAPIERLNFQNVLVGQIKAQKFTELPLCQQGSIKTIAKGEHTDDIAASLLKWPRRAVYLCPTNDRAQIVNMRIRRKYLGAPSMDFLVPGDIVDIHNRTLDLQVNQFDERASEWISSGEFARVVSADVDVQTKSISLKGRESATTVRFANAKIECCGRTSEIFYLPDYLAAPKPELTQDQTIALQIWAREEAEEKLAKQKEKLDPAAIQSAEHDLAKAQYQKQRNDLILASRYTNAARLRYAYAVTVHRAQAYEPLSLVVLDGQAAHDTDNPATDSYFRWLYTATICTSDALHILGYPELTPLSKAEWSFEAVRHVPITFKPTLYFKKDREPTDAELSTPLPSGFSNPKPELLALLLTVYELVNDTDWYLETITQHNYKERYTFSSDRGEVSIDLNYNGKYEVSVGKATVERGPEVLAKEIKGLLNTVPFYSDQNIEMAVSIFKDYLARKQWSIISIDEKPYKVYLIADHEVGKVKLELNVPSDSKKGLVSSVKLHQADSKEAADQFKKDFLDG